MYSHCKIHIKRLFKEVITHKLPYLQPFYELLLWPIHLYRPLALSLKSVLVQTVVNSWPRVFILFSVASSTANLFYYLLYFRLRCSVLTRKQPEKQLTLEWFVPVPEQMWAAFIPLSTVICITKIKSSVGDALHPEPLNISNTLLLYHYCMSVSHNGKIRNHDIKINWCCYYATLK